jgi:DNA-binding PadR family transcriptional regulator
MGIESVSCSFPFRSEAEESAVWVSIHLWKASFLLQNVGFSKNKYDSATDMYYYVAIMAASPLGEFEQIVLLAILRLGDTAYGVKIRNEIEECTGRKITPGALYTTLERLERKSMLVGRSGEPTAIRGGRAKRFYTLTSRGRSQLIQAQTGFQRLLTGLELLGGESNG